MRCVVIILSASLLTLSTGTLSAQDAPGGGVTDSHKLLEKEVGTWDVACTFWMSPDAPPFKSTGTEVNAWMPGGLWLLSEFECGLGPAQFHGRAQVGYDARAKKYVGTWIDSMTPTVTKMEGSYDEKSDTFTYRNTGTDASTGKPMVMESEMSFTGDGKRLAEFWMIGEDGKRAFKMMRFEYTLRKE